MSNLLDNKIFNSLNNIIIKESILQIIFYYQNINWQVKQLINKIFLKIILKKNISMQKAYQKSPLKDYTSILQQSRTKKKDAYPQRGTYQRSTYQRYSSLARRLNPSSYESSYQPIQSSITRQVQQLNTKLQVALHHNSSLLTQNQTLSEITNQLRYELKNVQEDILALTRDGQENIKNTRKQREILLQQVQIKTINHQQQLKKLLEQVSQLHTEKNNIEILNNKQIDDLKNQFEKSLMLQMQNLRNVQSNSKELYQSQIRNLKQTINKQQLDTENARSIQRLQKNRLKDEIKAMQTQTKKLKQRYQIDIKEAQREYEYVVACQKKRNQNQRQIQSNSLSLKIKRLKKQLLQKAQDLQTANKKMYHNEQTSQLQSITFKKDKQNLLAQLTSNQILFKTSLTKQKTKLQQLARLQIQNLTILYQTNIDQLKGEVTRCRLLIDCKTEQIKETYQQNRLIKQAYGQEMEQVRQQNSQLKEKLKNRQLEFRQQQQMMKVKLATLIQTNIQQISSYYQNELSNISNHNRQVQKINKQLKQRIYTLIYQNDQLRKNFQIQSSKSKARIQDLKIKLASISLQHKQHIGSLTSKVQLTSQTLIRQSQTKQRSKSFYDEEKRKFYAIVHQKDKEIADMMEIIKNVKDMHEQELKSIRSQKDQFRQEIEKLQLDKQRIKETLEAQLLSKDNKLKSMTYDNEKELQQIRTLQSKLQQTQKRKIQLQRQVQHLIVTSQSMAQQLGLSKGFIESYQLQSNAAINQQKTKFRLLVGAHQVSLKQYYQQTTKSKNKDIQKLQRIVAEKEEDIRDLIVKYNGLEKRFQMCMEAQQKMGQFEEKIRNLGLDQNLVKNMAELFAKKA